MVAMFVMQVKISLFIGINIVGTFVVQIDISLLQVLT